MADAISAEEFLEQHIPLLAQYMEVETLWKMRALSRGFRAALAPETHFWWSVVKETAQDPPLNPYAADVAWFLVALALRRAPSQLERVVRHWGPAPLTSAGRKLLAIGRVDHAATLLRAALTARGNDDNDAAALADAEYDLGIALGMLGEVAEAEKLRRQALEHNRAARGESAPQVAQCLFAIGDALFVGNDLDGAQRMYDDAAKLSAAAGDAEALATVRCGLALVAAKRGDDAAAVAHLEEALATRLRLRGELHADTARVLVNLGAVLAKTGDARRAAECFQRAWTARAHSLGPDHALSCRAKRLAELYASK